MECRLSEAALSDLRSVLLFTEEQFGLDRAVALNRRLSQALDRLAASPLIGRARAELDPPGRHYRYATILGNYLVVYHLTGDEVRVARIVHAARDVAKELEREPGDNGSVREAPPAYGEEATRLRHLVSSQRKPSHRRQAITC